MMKKFQVSAPGKIILHGEHSVVYNKAAIAGPIGLKTYFNFEETSNDFIVLQYERLNLTARMPLSNVNLLLSELDCNESLQPMDFLQKFRNSKDFILKYIEHNFDERKLNDKEEMAVGATLYILNRILRCEKVKAIKQGFDIKIDSDMSIGAGVGSSASYGVCLAAGFYIYSQILVGKLDDQQLKEFSFERNDTVLERISLWAFDSEVIMHEKPSGECCLNLFLLLNSSLLNCRH
jgi:mevalonate kinase